MITMIKSKKPALFRQENGVWARCLGALKELVSVL